MGNILIYSENRINITNEVFRHNNVLFNAGDIYIVSIVF